MAQLRLVCPDLLEDGWWGSSTQCSAYGSWILRFDGGEQDGGGHMGHQYRVRLVRRLIMQSFDASVLSTLEAA